jgi:homoserine kinase
MLAVCLADRQRAVASAMIEAFDDADVAASAYQTRVGSGARVVED